MGSPNGLSIGSNFKDRQTRDHERRVYQQFTMLLLPGTCGVEMNEDTSILLTLGLHTSAIVGY